MVKLKLADSADYLAISRDWPSDFTLNNRPEKYPCLAVVDISPGTHLQERIQVTYVYIDDFFGLGTNAEKFYKNKTYPPQ